MKIYCGIGSRSAPTNILETMTKIAEHLAVRGWILRSGGANGSDLSFEKGANNVEGFKEIYLPWKNFNDSTSHLFTPSKEAFVLASTIHPAWNYLTDGAKKLHARNVHQVLGLSLESPADLVVCWMPNGKEAGGTATALKIAKLHNIPIINLAAEVFDFTAFL